MDTYLLPLCLRPFTAREKEIVAAINKASAWNFAGEDGRDAIDALQEARTMRLLDQHGDPIMFLTQGNGLTYARSIAEWALTGKLPRSLRSTT